MNGVNVDNGTEMRHFTFNDIHDVTESRFYKTLRKATYSIFYSKTNKQKFPERSKDRQERQEERNGEKRGTEALFTPF